MFVLFNSESTAAKHHYRWLAGQRELHCSHVHWSRMDIAQDEVDQFIVQHPQLVELALYDSFQCNADAAITLVRELKSLKTIRLEISNDTERDNFIEQLGDDRICETVYDDDVEQFVTNCVCNQKLMYHDLLRQSATI